MEVSTLKSDLGQDQFLKLLVAQLQAQDPLDPVKNEDFVAQLAQFSTLEGIERLNTSFSDLLKLNQITQGSNLIGRTVDYQDSTTGELAQGTVEGFNLNDGRLQLLANGIEIPLDNVRTIS